MSLSYSLLVLMLTQQRDTCSVLGAQVKLQYAILSPKIKASSPSTDR
jgi:hypothetical protein